MKIVLPTKTKSTTFNQIFYGVIITFISINIFNIFASAHCFVDNVEHLHAAYFINIGLVPYKDFFEHHNPLLWFFLAPLTKFLYNNIAIFYVVRGIAILFHLINLWLIYKITAKFLYNKKVAQFSILILLSIPYIWLDTTIIRPDIFMYTCFLSALYLFFGYLENKKAIYLINSYYLLVLSFLFLQKFLPLCALMLVINLYFVYRKKIPLQHFFIAIEIALIPLILFVAYLYVYDAFSDWFYYNFQFNLYIKEYYNNFTFGIPKVIIFLTILFFIITVKSPTSSTNIRIFYGLYLTSALFLLTWRPFIHYYLPFFMFSAPLISKIAEKRIEYTKTILLVLCSFVYATYSIFPSAYLQREYQQKLSLAQFIIENTSEQNTILDIDIAPADIFNKPHDYHWFGYHNNVIADILTHPTHMLDLNQLIKSTKPEYIHYDYKQKLDSPTNDLIIQKINKPLIIRNIYLLKKARQHPQLLQKITYIENDFYNIDIQWLKKNYHPTKIDSVWQKNSFSAFNNMLLNKYTPSQKKLIEEYIKSTTKIILN